MSLADVTKYNCAYCGEMARCRDHVIPVSYSQVCRGLESWNKSETVPACRECNGMLSNLWFPSVAERAGYLARILATRYKTLMDMPEWSDAELREMSGKMKRLIRSNLKKRKVIVERIEYAQTRALMETTKPEECWDAVTFGSETSI